MYTISPHHGGRKHSSPTDDQVPPEYQDEDLEEDENPNCFVRGVTKVQTTLREGYEEHEKLIWRIFYIILLLAYAAYFAYAMYYHFGDEGSVRLLWVTCLIVACVFLAIFFGAFGDAIWRCLEPCTNVLRRHEELASW